MLSEVTTPEGLINSNGGNKENDEFAWHVIPQAYVNIHCDTWKHFFRTILNDNRVIVATIEELISKQF